MERDDDEMGSAKVEEGNKAVEEEFIKGGMKLEEKTEEVGISSERFEESEEIVRDSTELEDSVEMGVD